MGRESEWPRHNETQIEVDIENISRNVAEFIGKIQSLQRTCRSLLKAMKFQDERTDVLSKGIKINGESIQELLKRIEKLEQKQAERESVEAREH